LNTTVVICSVHRPEILSETVDSLVRRQSVPPREIIISVINQEHVAEKTRAYSAVRVVVGNRQGTCAQRNVAARLVRTPYTLFLDDDVELASNYIESMEGLLYEDDGVVAATGFLTVDGAQGDVGLDREIARSCVANYIRKQTNYDHENGQNLFVRTQVFHHVLFDESLPLYGWLEDFDFATNVLRYGRIVMNAGTCWAHIGAPSGRTSGVRYGYSQIVNPLYLWRKNRKPGMHRVIFEHWLRYLASNGRRALIRLPTDRTDRAGRLTGNLIALSHILTGRVDPTYILRLSRQSNESSLPIPVRGSAASRGFNEESVT
jgi:GT2 family glycosyltransferase